MKKSRGLQRENHLSQKCLTCVAQPTFFTKTDFKSCADLGRLEEEKLAPVEVAVWPSPSAVAVYKQ